MPGNHDIHQFDLIEEIEEAVCFLTEDWRIAFSNDRLAEILGGTTADYLGRDFRSLFPEDRLESLEIGYRTAKEGLQARLQVGMHSRRRSEPIPVLLRLIRYTDPDSNAVSFFAIILDLSELYESLMAQEFLRQRNRELEDMAITCPLTGIYNRRYFDYRYSEEMRRARRYRHGLGLALIDIDSFKSINENYGHLIGDSVLRSVAQDLKRAIRNSDILARYGGDEFAALLPEAQPSAALAVGLRMRMRIASTKRNKNRVRAVGNESSPPQITVSIGVTSLSPFEEEVSEEDFLRRADEALFRAKDDGKNRVMLWGHPV